MKRIGLFIDVSNLYFCINNKSHGRKIDYRKLQAWVKDLGEIQTAVAYGAQKEQEAFNFVKALNHIGFRTKFKTPKEYNNNGKIRRKADHDVTIAVDVMSMLDKFDMIVLGTADGDLLPLVEFAMAKGVQVLILGSSISSDLRKCGCICTEIPESMLEQKTNETKEATKEASDPK